MRRTFVASADVLGIDGELLITLYDDGMTLAYRERGSDSWGIPHMVSET